MAILYKSTAFSAVSLVLFFFSIIFVSGAIGKGSSPGYDDLRTRKLITLVAIDLLAVYLLLVSRTATGINDHNNLVTISAAGFSNALYALSSVYVSNTKYVG